MSADALGINIPELVLLNDQERVLADIGAFGFRHIRIEVPWRWYEPVKGIYRDRELDKVRNLVATGGLTPLVIVGTVAPTHMPSFTWTPADARNYMTRVHARLGAPAYEIGNEPNLHNFNPWSKVAPVVAMLGVAAASLGGAQRVSPGLAAGATSPWWYFWFKNRWPEEFLAEQLKTAGGNNFNLVGYHPYSVNAGFVPEVPSNNQTFIRRIPTLRNLAQRPVWATEWGFSMEKVGPTQGAVRFHTQLAALDYWEVPRSYLFCWRDWSGHGGSYGLVDSNNVPRQPYYDTVREALR